MAEDQIELGEVVEIMSDCIKVIRGTGVSEAQADAIKLLEHCIHDLINALINVSSSLGSKSANGIVSEDKFTILKKGAKHDNKLN